MQRLKLVVAAGVILTLMAAGLTWAAAPRPPRDLVVIDPGGDQGNTVKLTWRKSLDDGAGANNATGYNVYKRLVGSAFALSHTVPATGAATYSTIVGGLTRNRAYDFAVTCTNGTQESVRVIVSLTPTDTSVPRPPRELVGVDPAHDQGTNIRLVFRRSLDDGLGAGDVKFYTIRRRVAGLPFAEVGRVNASGAGMYSYIATGLALGTEYGFGVDCSDGINKSVLSNVVWITPTDTEPPRPPRELVAVDPVGDQGNSIRLNFRKSLDDGAGANDVTTYTIHQRLSDGPFAEIGTAPATGADSYSYLVANLTRGTRYGFGVDCTDGRSASTRVVVWVTPVDTTPPGPPRTVALADTPDDDGGALTLSFDASVDDGGGANDVALYRYARRVGTDTWVELGTIPATGAATYTEDISGLPNNEPCTIGVTADDGAQQSSRVNASARPLDNTPARPPLNLTVADFPNDAGTSLLVEWDASLDDVTGDREVTKYRVFRSTSAASQGSGVGDVPATAAAGYEFQDTGLIRGTTYYYVAIAIAPTGNSEPSNQASGKPLDDRPAAAPRLLTAADRPYDNGGAIDLSWRKSLDDGAGVNHVNRYFVYRRIANLQSDPDKVGTITATGSATYNWTDTKVPMDLILYEYTVRAVTVGGVQSAAVGPAKAAAEDNNVLVFQPPTDLKVADVPADGGGQLLLTWNRSPSEDDIGPPPPPPLMVQPQAGYGGDYEFYRRTASGAYPSRPSFLVSAAGSDDPMTYTDTGLTNGTRYFYKVRYRRYNQISEFTAEASAIPAVGTASVSSTASADSDLAVSLVSPAATVASGSDLVVEVAVRGVGASSVALEWSRDGASAGKTAAVSGQDDYQATLRLKTSGLSRGTVLQVRAVVAAGQSSAASEAVQITVE